MDQATLDGCAAKVDRAEELLNLLAREWRAFLDMNPWPSRIDDRTDPPWHRVYLDFTTPPPPRFSIRVGELSHDLRSALDHLMWREAVEHVGLQEADANASVITFPLAKNPAAFKSAKALQYVGKDARAIAERHQPYEGAEHKRPLSLGLLRWFNNMDKHRTIQVTAVGAPSFFTLKQLYVTFAKGAKITAVQPCLEPGQLLVGETEIVRIQFAPDGPQPNVEMHRTPPVNPSFGHPPEPLRGIDISHTISKVREVIADFADLLP